MKRMNGIALLFSFACAFNSSYAENYYVSPDGNDTNPGTKLRPWRTWKHAFTSSWVQPGDTVFFRGGVYYAGGTHLVTRSGIAGKPVCYHSFPGETPILDCINYFPTGDPNTNGTWYNEVIYVIDQEYIEFKGLTVRNVRQSPEHMTDVKAFYFCYGTEIKAINCTAYNIWGTGFYSRFKEEGNHYFINCDAFNCCDSLSPEPRYLPGNRGTGFGCHNFTAPVGHAYYKGCRAWRCGDQGFSSSDPYVEWDSCWSFNNGLLRGSGHGYKLGWVTKPADKVRRVMKNCIAAYNEYSGMVTNDGGHPNVCHMNIYNNSFYNNGFAMDVGYGIWVSKTEGDNYEEERKRVFRNNISFGNKTGSIHVDGGAHYTHENNNWDTPGINVTREDFLSLDTTGMSGPRKPDGSLPDLDFLKLAPGSDLIDAGSTNTGMPYHGEAPDLGAWEYGLELEMNDNQPPSVSITSPSDGREYSAPAEIELQVTAEDPDGSIIRVEFFNGGIKLDEKVSAPWSWTWSDVPSGTYSLAAVAADNAGSRTRSSVIRVHVIDYNDTVNTPPAVEIVSPSDGEEFREQSNIQIRAHAEDPDGSVATVEFFSGDSSLAELTSDPWTFEWQPIPAGIHSLTVEATDDLGGTTHSEIVTVYIKHNNLPSVMIISPGNGNRVKEPAYIDIDALAEDSDGEITKVEFFCNGIKLGERNYEPWSLTWQNPPPGLHCITAAATDDLNARAESQPVDMVVLSDIKVYPNPGDGDLRLTLTDSLVNRDIQIRAITPDGKVVRNKSIAKADKNQRMNLRDLPTGIYILMILSDNKRYIKRVFKR